MASPSNLDVISTPLTPDSEFEELMFPDYSHGHAFPEDFVPTEGIINLPYAHVYQQSCSFYEIRRSVFIPGKAVECRILNVERNISGNILSPHIYILEMKHSDFQWVIRRRYVQFLNLHRQLQMHRAGLKLKFHTNPDSDRKSFRAIARTVQTLPKFPIKPDSTITEDRLLHRARQLERYLNSVLKCIMFRDYVEMLKFLEVSHFSFIRDLGVKSKEGMVQKRAGSARITNGCDALLLPLRGCFSRWLERWLVLKDTCLIIIRPKDGVVREVFLMDKNFDIKMGFFNTGRWSGLTLTNQNRKLTISGPSRERTDEWFEEIALRMRTTGLDFIRPQRFGSFAPIRYDSMAQWFVDGAGYFEAVANVLELATEEIFISGWMLSTELFLKRPIVGSDKWRFDNILKRKAESGIKIFILLYKEVEFALSINSNYTRNQLMKLHPENIKIIRHPDHVTSGVMFWAHHEKMVVVDQTYAFIGGMDMCFGRWDDYQHRLIDLGELYEVVPNKMQTYIRSSYAVRSLANTLFQEMALAPLAALGVDGTEQQNLEAARGEFEHYISQTSNDTITGTKLWPGKDYMNFIYKDFSGLDRPFDDLIDRTSVVRMPWHDIGVAVVGQAGRDIARHFIQRWNAAKVEKFKDNSFYPCLLPKSYKPMEEAIPVITRLKNVNCQIIRSCSSWSAGINEIDNSIEQAYVKIIMEAKHFIYIENQFFISHTGGSCVITNKIAESLFVRIVRAHRERQLFKVFIIMPLLPAFEGEIGQNSGVALHAITYWNYSSICRGPNSLLVNLAREVGDPTAYVIFCGLRTHSEGLGQPVSELVYVHSKMIIVDDRTAIIGSANINDRSLKGDRDSEIAVIIEDVDTFESRMAEKSWLAGRFVGSLRRNLFREHLGLNEKSYLEIDIADPVADSFFKGIWLKFASRNTAIFEQVFRCIPNDHIKKFSQLKEYVKISPLSETNPKEANALLLGIQGNIVLLPLHFLSDEVLTPPPSSKEALMPICVWT